MAEAQWPDPDPVVVGLDLSLAHSGVAILFPSGAVEMFTVSTKNTGQRPTDRSRRIMRIRDAVVKPIAALDPRPTMVLVEEHPTGVMTKGGHQFERGGVFVAIVHALDCLGIEVVGVNVSHVKMFATGKGSGAGTDKVAVATAIGRRYPAATIGSEHEADALVLASIGAVRMRHSRLPFTPTEPMRMAIGRVQWPDSATHGAPS